MQHFTIVICRFIPCGPPKKNGWALGNPTMGSTGIYYDKHKLYKSFNHVAIENISQCNS